MALPPDTELNKDLDFSTMSPPAADPQPVTSGAVPSAFGDRISMRTAVIILIVALIGTLVAVAMWYARKQNSSAKIIVPKGFKLDQSKNAPPRLQQIDP